MGIAGARDDVAIDLAVLAELMRGDGVDVSGHLTAERVGVGQSNLTYLVEPELAEAPVVRVLEPVGQVAT